MEAFSIFLVSVSNSSKPEPRGSIPCRGPCRRFSSTTVAPACLGATDCRAPSTPSPMNFGGVDAFFFVLLKNSERIFSSDYCCLHFLDVDGLANCSAILFGCASWTAHQERCLVQFHGRSFCCAFFLQWKFVPSPKKGSLVSDDARPRSSP
jgi:hypothetical protein